jgi:hypothetical protein
MEVMKSAGKSIVKISNHLGEVTFVQQTALNEKQLEMLIAFQQREEEDDEEQASSEEEEESNKRPREEEEEEEDDEVTPEYPPAQEEGSDLKRHRAEGAEAEEQVKPTSPIPLAPLAVE